MRTATVDTSLLAPFKNSTVGGVTMNVLQRVWVNFEFNFGSIEFKSGSTLSLSFGQPSLSLGQLSLSSGHLSLS